MSHEHERVEGPDEKVSPQNKIRTTAQPRLPILFPFLGPCRQIVINARRDKKFATHHQNKGGNREKHATTPILGNTIPNLVPVSQPNRKPWS